MDVDDGVITSKKPLISMFMLIALVICFITCASQVVIKEVNIILLKATACLATRAAFKQSCLQETTRDYTSLSAVNISIYDHALLHTATLIGNIVKLSSYSDNNSSI